MKTFLAICAAVISSIILFFSVIVDFITQIMGVLILSIIYIFKTVGIALAGGFADYYMTTKETGEKFSFKKAFFQTFVAGFAGFLTIKLCLYFNVDSNLLGFLCGISGFAGVRALRFFESLTKKTVETIATVKFDIKKNVDKENDNKVILDHIVKNTEEKSNEKVDEDLVENNNNGNNM